MHRNVSRCTNMHRYSQSQIQTYVWKYLQMLHVVGQVHIRSQFRQYFRAVKYTYALGACSYFKNIYAFVTF